MAPTTATAVRNSSAVPASSARDLMEKLNADASKLNADQKESRDTGHRSEAAIQLISINVTFGKKRPNDATDFSDLLVAFAYSDHPMK